METFTLRNGIGSFVIEGNVLPMGKDILVVLSGGEGHIGAIGMAEPRPSMRNPGMTSSSSSVFTYAGHKEDVVVKEISEFLSKEMNRKVVVVAGLHWRNLNGEEIAAVIESCRVLAKKIVQRTGKT
ncbi:MAG TPA: hypothetical protein PLR60_06780 [Syntrophorhabdaceae bacterium]|nr:hypothetical protein [Syntrophorhabdaceae bacterium]